jgi:hypothetical protein
MRQEKIKHQGRRVGWVCRKKSTRTIKNSGFVVCKIYFLKYYADDSQASEIINVEHKYRYKQCLNSPL